MVSKRYSMFQLVILVNSLLKWCMVKIPLVVGSDFDGNGLRGDEKWRKCDVLLIVVVEWERVDRRWLLEMKAWLGSVGDYVLQIDNGWRGKR